MKRLIALVVVLAGVLALTACNPPAMEQGGWIWDPNPSHPILVDDRPQPVDVSALWRWNAAAGTTILAMGGGANADITFQSWGRICFNNDCVNGRHAMYVQRTYTGGYVSHCNILYDPTYPAETGNYMALDALTVAHEVGHCLDYPDVYPPTDYQGIMSNYAFWDQAWRDAHWFGPDDQQMLARDGYGP
jgi:hypothetical protein